MIDLHSGRVLPSAAPRFGAASQKQPAGANAAPALRRLVGADRRFEEGAGAAQTQRIFRQEHEFVRDDDADAENARRWETRMARRYYDALHKEYAICDLSRWREGAVGLRWRTAAEVTSGKGERICAARRLRLRTACGASSCPSSTSSRAKRSSSSSSAASAGAARRRSRAASAAAAGSRDRSRRDRDDRRDRKKKKKKEKSKAPVIPEADIKFMDTLRRDIQTMGPLRSNHLERAYKRHPEIPPKGRGRDLDREAVRTLWLNSEEAGDVRRGHGVSTSADFVTKLNIVADRQEDRPPSQLPEPERRRLNRHVVCSL